MGWIMVKHVRDNNVPPGGVEIEFERCYLTL